MTTLTTLAIMFGLMLIQALFTTAMIATFFVLVIWKQNKISETDHQKRRAEAERLRAIRDKAAKEADERMKLED